MSATWKSKWGLVSLSLFLVFVAFQLGLLFWGIKYLFPTIWAQQINAGPPRFLLVFAVVSVCLCFLEWFVHRDVLHTVVVSWLRGFYHSHGRHHGLTVIALKDKTPAGKVIISRYDIVEEKQWEAVSFADYILVAFFVFCAAPLALLQSFFGDFPFLIGGYSAIAVYFALYEILHQFEHRPDEWWERRKRNPMLIVVRPLIVFLRRFHQYHHLYPYYNMAIVGCLGFPLADTILGTYCLPGLKLAHGGVVDSGKLNPPKPNRFVSGLDNWAQKRGRRLLMEISARSKASQ